MPAVDWLDPPANTRTVLLIRGAELSLEVSLFAFYNAEVQNKNSTRAAITNQRLLARRVKLRTNNRKAM